MRQTFLRLTGDCSLIFCSAPVSPELNPCELVFGKAKNYMYYHRGDLNFLVEVAIAFSSVTYDDVLHWYMKCLP
jgi:hypothetical protein